MATLDNIGSTATATLNAEQRAALLERQRQALAASREARGAPLSLASAGGPITGAQQRSTPITPATQAQPASLSTAGSAPTQPAAMPSLEQFRPTNIGQNASGGQIVARVNASGTTEFSNMGADQLAAQNATPITAANPLRPASLSNVSAAPGRQSDPNASLASLGSAGNIGNGVGAFSQAAPGDAKLAMDRFEEARVLREGYANQDRLDLANARQELSKSVIGVQDSSRPVTASEVRRLTLEMAGEQQKTAALQDGIANAQAQITGTQQRRAGEQSLRQTKSLADLQAAALAPGASPDDVQNYQMAADPAGYLKAQQSGGLNSLKATKQQLEIEKLRVETEQKQTDRTKKEESAAATFDQALSSVDALLGTEVDPNNPAGPRLNEDPGLTSALGRVQGLLPTLPGTQAADFEARLDTLKAQTFLPQVQALKGAGALSDAEGKKLSDSIGALSTKMSEGAFRKSLADVRNTLSSARERSAPGRESQGQVGLQVGQAEDGYVFLGGDPAQQSSWRAQ